MDLHHNAWASSTGKYYWRVPTSLLCNLWQRFSFDCMSPHKPPERIACRLV
jgi:hypothetical protein